MVLIHRNFLKKINLASLRLENHKLNIDKLETTPVDLSNLSDVVRNEVVKKTVFDESVKNVDVIQASDAGKLVKKAEYNTKISEIEKKILGHNHEKSITTQEVNKLTSENFATRLK